MMMQSDTGHEAQSSDGMECPDLALPRACQLQLQLHRHPLIHLPRPIATSTLRNHAMEPILFAAVLMLFVTKFTALTAVTVYFINS
jgi:hypothetical protein